MGCNQWIYESYSDYTALSTVAITGLKEQMRPHVQHLSGQLRTRNVHQMKSINEYRARNLRIENRKGLQSGKQVQRACRIGT